METRRDDLSVTSCSFLLSSALICIDLNHVPMICRQQMIDLLFVNELFFLYLYKVKQVTVKKKVSLR